MRPVHWSLKNQWTAHAIPVTDILCRVGISMRVVGAAWAEKRVLLPRTECATMMTTHTRIGCWHVLHHNTSYLCLVGDELLQLEERPGVPVLPCIRFGGAALSAALTDARQVFETDTRVAPLCQDHHVLGEAMIDMRDNAPFPAFELLDRAMFPHRLQRFAACGIDTADMAETRCLPEEHWTIRHGRSQGHVLPPVNPYPAACGFSIGNIHRHRETGIPDTLPRTPQLDGAR
jgi:hypothetical protein